LDKKIKGGDIISGKPEKDKKIKSDGGTGEGRSKRVGKAWKPGIHCIGEICFTEDGVEIVIPKEADRECARKVADLITGGKGRVDFRIESEVKVEDTKDKEQKISELKKQLKELESGT